MDAGDYAAFVAAGASTLALVVSIYTARYAAGQAERLERVKWSRDNLSDAVVAVFTIFEPFVADLEQYCNTEMEFREPIERFESGDRKGLLATVQRLQVIAGPQLSSAAGDLLDAIHAAWYDPELDTAILTDEELCELLADEQERLAKAKAALTAFRRAARDELGVGD